MPFGEIHVVDERRRFVTEVHRSLWSCSAICRRYGISRPTGYEWLRRWEHEGPPGLQDQSSRPSGCPWATPPHVVEAILDVRRAHDDYGAKKIIWYLERHQPNLPLPSRTTVHNIFLRHDLVPKRRKRLRRWHPGRPDTFAAQPNDTSVWFIQLDILPQLIEPGCPQQNGKHENMHRVLKRKATRPPRANIRCQQRAFNDFCTEYNRIRPHEALNGAVPADLYEPSPRPFPSLLRPITYPGHFETRLVSRNGGIRWYVDRVLVTTLLAGHHVGLEEIDHGLFNVYFGPVWLGHFFEPKRLILDSPDPRRTKRKRSGGAYKGRRTVKKVR